MLARPSVRRAAFFAAVRTLAVVSGAAGVFRFPIVLTTSDNLTLRQNQQHLQPTDTQPGNTKLNR